MAQMMTNTIPAAVVITTDEYQRQSILHAAGGKLNVKISNWGVT